MKHSITVVIASAWLLAGPVVFAQSAGPTPPPPSPDPVPATAPASPPPAAAPGSNPSAAASAGGKRASCMNEVQGLKGQDKRDHMQLCMAQARVDCLKQAIDQKIVGPQRHDFMKTCANE